MCIHCEKKILPEFQFLLSSIAYDRTLQLVVRYQLNDETWWMYTADLRSLELSNLKVCFKWPELVKFTYGLHYFRLKFVCAYF